MQDLIFKALRRFASYFRPLWDACGFFLIAYVIRGYFYVCGSTLKPGTTVFAVERLWHPKTGENSMFASDLSGHQDWMLGLRRPEGLRFVRQGFQP